MFWRVFLDVFWKKQLGKLQKDLVRQSGAKNYSQKCFQLDLSQNHLFDKRFKKNCFSSGGRVQMNNSVDKNTFCIINTFCTEILLLTSTKLLQKTRTRPFLRVLNLYSAFIKLIVLYGVICLLNRCLGVLDE